MGMHFFKFLNQWRASHDHSIRKTNFDIELGLPLRYRESRLLTLALAACIPACVRSRIKFRYMMYFESESIKIAVKELLANLFEVFQESTRSISEDMIRQLHQW